MKILEAQSAVLTNWEVYNFLAEQQRQQADPQGKKRRRRGPPNLETVVRELMEYLRTYPNPLSRKDLDKFYSADSVRRLLERLRPYDLLKAEVAMMLNLRPASVVALSTVVEDLGERFTEEQQEEILAVVTDVLGQPEEQDQGQMEGEGGETRDVTV